MEENSSNQNSQQDRMGSQQSGMSKEEHSNDSYTEQNRGNRQVVSNEQDSRLESQPGNMSGVETENQRSRNGNQDLGSQGSDRKSTENL